MNIERVVMGDIVECLRRERRFHAVVTGRDGAKLTCAPLTYNCSYHFASAREVVGHWAARPSDDGRPRTRAIHDGDVIAFGPADALSYARVVHRDGRILRVAELRSAATPPRELGVTDVRSHFARRGRRRPTR